MSEKVRKDIKEPPMVVTVPLVLLSIPSIVLGAVMIYPTLFTRHGLLGSAIPYVPELNVLKKMAFEFEGLVNHTIHGLFGLPFWFSIAGVFVCMVVLSEAT